MPETIRRGGYTSSQPECYILLPRGSFLPQKSSAWSLLTQHCGLWDREFLWDEHDIWHRQLHWVLLWRACQNHSSLHPTPSLQTGADMWCYIASCDRIDYWWEFLSFAGFGMDKAESPRFIHQSMVDSWLRLGKCELRHTMILPCGHLDRFSSCYWKVAYNCAGTGKETSGKESFISKPFHSTRPTTAMKLLLIVQVLEYIAFL